MQASRGFGSGIIALAATFLFCLLSPRAIAEPMTLKSAAQKAILTNPEVLARYHAFRASEGELQAVTSAMLPHLDYTASKSKIDREDPLLTGKYSEYNRSLQLTQVLWDGLGSWYQKRQFDHARLVRLFEFFDASETAALEAGRAYLDVLRYRKLVELAEDNYIQHRSVYEQIEARVKAGVGRRVDFEQASGRLALAESNLIVEISNLHDVSARFQRLVGEPPHNVLEYPAPLSSDIPGSIREALERSYSLNPQVRAAVENVRASAYARDVRRSAYQPKVEFRLREDRGTDLNGTAGLTRNQVAEVLLNFNIFNGLGDKGRNDQAIGLYDAARDQRDKACRDVRQTLEIAYNDVRKLVEQKTYLEQHRLSVEKARDAYRKQFDIGQRSLLDLLDTENELFQARRAEANAELDLATAYARVHAGSGKLLHALGLSALDSDLINEGKNWGLGEESPEQCPPEPVFTYAADKDQLNQRAAEMTRDKVRAMLDAIASRREALDGGQGSTAGAVPFSTSPPAVESKSVGKQVADAMTLWAAAWSKGDVSAYLSLYAPSFMPADGRSRAEWVRTRTSAISRAKDIKLVITRQQIDVRDATHATVRFHQKYSSASYADEVDKMMEWQFVDGQWRIASEAITVSVGRLDEETRQMDGVSTAVKSPLKIDSEKDAINEWADAWRVGDTVRFDLRYSQEFVASNGMSRGEWIEQEMRKSAFSRSKGIGMSIGDLEISPVAADRSRGALTQIYQSTEYSQQVQKVLTLEKVPGDWRIIDEVVTSTPVSVAAPQRAAVDLLSLPMPPSALMPEVTASTTAD